jgi:hypothetical protein
MAKNEEPIEKDGFDFGDYAIADGVEHHFEKLPGKSWIIKPVTSKAEINRSRFMLHNRVVETVDGTRYEMPPTAVEVRNREVALLFGGTNLTTKSGKPVIQDDPPIQEVEALLEKMPPEMVNEIWVKIGQVYPKWGPADPKEWMETKPEA